MIGAWAEIRKRHLRKTDETCYRLSQNVLLIYFEKSYKRIIRLDWTASTIRSVYDPNVLIQDVTTGLQAGWTCANL